MKKIKQEETSQYDKCTKENLDEICFRAKKVLKKYKYKPISEATKTNICNMLKEVGNQNIRIPLFELRSEGSNVVIDILEEVDI